jgi:putative ABC transport system substrate-binding protein
MRRREFLGVLGGAAAVWPVAARTQQAERMRRIGALITRSADDPESQLIVGAFLQGLQELGWTLGRNVRIDYRWGAVDEEGLRRYAAEAVGLAPDVILATGSSTVRALQRATSTVPIVFAATGDPIAGGLVATLARPGGNATGFISIEYGMSPKWLELLKQVAPRVTRIGVLRDPTTAGGLGQFGAIQGVAASFGVEVSPIDSRDAKAMERSLGAFARGSNGGLVVTTSRFARRYRDLIITLAARHKLPVVYPNRSFVIAGGLMSYGTDYIDQFRQAAGYVDRILKGEKPSDLPVQQPTKFELVINLKTAKALGLTLPPTLLARADEVIE